MSQPLIDHRGPQFVVLLCEVLDALKKLFQTAQGKILLFPGSGKGGWESCIVNTLFPGDQVLGCVNGHFSNLYCRTATSHGVKVQRLEVDYGAGLRLARLKSACA
jgi:alanine-glyoxylate transaminase/serine-glyoxylate transaminase/serine-pyruvate transaminase